MQTDLTGRELAEAAARAMGWTYDGTDWFDAEKYWLDCESPDPTEREMLAWLHERGVDGADVKTMSSKHWCRATLEYAHWKGFTSAQGTDLREALARLVVAVKEREAKA